MQISVTDCPIQPFLDKTIQPEIVFDKRPSDTWCVAVKPIRFNGEPTELVTVNRGDLVRVPLFAYRTIDTDLATLVGFSMELAVRALLYSQHAPLRMHLALGRPVIVVENDAGETAYRVHLGLAFLLSKIK